MPDREKVMKGLECCAQMDGQACRQCPYASECEEGVAGSVRLCADALVLLKEQAKQIDQLEYNLATTEDNLRYYINGND